MLKNFTSLPELLLYFCNYFHKFKKNLNLIYPFSNFIQVHPSKKLKIKNLKLPTLFRTSLSTSSLPLKGNVREKYCDLRSVCEGASVPEWVAGGGG
jgi:hypothetical protein